MLQWARAAWPGRMARIGGFLSDDPSRLAGHDSSLTIIASPEGFVPEPGDALLLAIRIPAARRRVAEALQLRGATFLTLIHPTAIVAPTPRSAKGPQSKVTANSCALADARTDSIIYGVPGCVGIAVALP